MEKLLEGLELLVDGLLQYHGGAAEESPMELRCTKSTTTSITTTSMWPAGVLKGNNHVVICLECGSRDDVIECCK